MRVAVKVLSFGCAALGGGVRVDRGAGAIHRRRPQAVRRPRQPHASAVVARVRNISRQRPRAHRLARARNLRLHETPCRHRRAGPAGRVGQGRQSRRRGSHPAVGRRDRTFRSACRCAGCRSASARPIAGEAVVVATTRRNGSLQGSPSAGDSADLRGRFGTVIGDVATTGNSGSGVFDAANLCLLGIISRKISVGPAAGEIWRAGRRDKRHRQVLRSGVRSSKLSSRQASLISLGRASRMTRRRRTSGRCLPRSNLVDGGPCGPKWWYWRSVPRENRRTGSACVLGARRSPRRRARIERARRRAFHGRAPGQVGEGFSVMGFARFAWMAFLACGVAAAYGVYAPEAADRWVPSAGGLAHDLHNRIWAQPSQTASAPGQQGQPNGPAPIVVSVTIGQAGRLSGRPREHRTGSGLQHRAGAGARRRPDREDRLQGRPDGERGRSARPDRSAAVSGRARSGDGEESAGRGQSRQRQARSGALRDARQAELRHPAATRHAELAGQSADRLDRGGRRGDRRRQGRNSTTRPFARPISGRVGFRLIDEGNLVNAGPADRHRSHRPDFSRSRSSSPSRRNMSIGSIRSLRPARRRSRS